MQHFCNSFLMTSECEQRTSGEWHRRGLHKRRLVQLWRLGVLEQEWNGVAGKRCKYLKLIPAQRIKIIRCAAKSICILKIVSIQKMKSLSIHIFMYIDIRNCCERLEIICQLEAKKSMENILSLILRNFIVYEVRRLSERSHTIKSMLLFSDFYLTSAVGTHCCGIWVGRDYNLAFLKLMCNIEFTSLCCVCSFRWCQIALPRRFLLATWQTSPLKTWTRELLSM